MLRIRPGGSLPRFRPAARRGAPGGRSGAHRARTTQRLTSPWDAAILPAAKRKRRRRSMKPRRSLTPKTAKRISPWDKCECSSTARPRPKKLCATPSRFHPTWGPLMQRWRRFCNERKERRSAWAAGESHGSQFPRLAEPIRACGAAESSRRDGSRHGAAAKSTASQSRFPRGARAIGHRAFAPR